MGQDWSAVSAALRERLDERGMTMTELAARSGVSLTTVRELVHVLNTRRRQARTLTALSTALGWPAEHLGDVLRGRPATGPSEREGGLVALARRVRALEKRVAALEGREDRSP